MNSKEVSTFCRVCEPVCGVLATVEDGRITRIRSNPDHVLSQGHFCKKAMGAVDVTYDPDRVIYPMKRTGGPGEFTRISWEQAYSEITERLTATRSQYGPAAFAIYSGNPPAFAAATMISTSVFTAALDVKWKYTVNFEDGVAILAACEILYGKAALTKPDFWRSHFALIVGANPVGSHGSIICEPIVSKALKSIVDRGGRVVAVDPRKGETAQMFEHLPIRAGADAFFLAAMLHEVIAQGYADQAFIDNNTRDFEQLKSALSRCTPEWASRHSGVPAQTICDLARDFGSAESACVYGRTGTCTQRYGTLSNILMQMIAIVTGNLDSPGGNSFGWGFMDYEAPLMNANPSRTTGMPDVGGMLGSGSLASDIEQAGDEQVRALFMVGANPALSAPGGDRLCQALDKLDLFFSIDLYINETNRYADYVLPGASMYEREDVPMLAMAGMMLRPSIYATPAVIDKQGEAKEDWEILYEIARRMGYGEAVKMTPREMIDGIIRSNEFGDHFGKKPEGLTLDKILSDHPNGVALMPHMPTGVITERLATPDKRIPLAEPRFVAEISELLADESFQSTEFPMRLHSMREPLTHNSWMHNAESLARADRKHYARLHADDAERYGIRDGGDMRIASPFGEVIVRAQVSDRMTRGNVALPHGWGHEGGWKIANERGGVNVNRLSSSSSVYWDRITGGSVLNGIPVHISAAEQSN